MQGSEGIAASSLLREMEKDGKASPGVHASTECGGAAPTSVSKAGFVLPCFFSSTPKRRRRTDCGCWGMKLAAEWRGWLRESADMMGEILFMLPAAGIVSDPTKLER